MKKFLMYLCVAVALSMTACTDDGVEAPKEGVRNGQEYVDLGLSVVWAKTNIGYSRMDVCGDYYNWGGTSTQPTYDMAHCHTLDLQLTNITGNSQYDVVTKTLENGWRLPTVVEFNELIRCCRWTWTTEDGVNGYRATGPNGNSIFFPCGGRVSFTTLDYFNELGCYWTGSCDRSIPETAYMVVFSENAVANERSMSRVIGANVRGVFER